MRCLFLAAFVSATVADFYVSPNGDDSASGTESAPFATVARAAAAVASSGGATTSDVIVYLRAGAYPQPSTLVFSSAHSGSSESARVRWVGGWPSDGPDDAIVHVHGGVPVTGFTQTTNPAIWSAPLPTSVTDTRTLYKDGSRVPQAAAGALGKSATIIDSGYTFAAADAPWLVESDLQSAADIEFLYTGVGSSWTESRLRVESLVPISGGLVNCTMAQPAWSFHARAYGQGLPNPTSTANIAAALASSAGSWTLNTMSRTIYYAPLAGENPGALDFIVPQVNVLVNLTVGATFMTFEGITFSFAGWLEPNSGLGYVDMQSGYRITSHADPSNDDLWVPVPGNIQVHNSSHIDFVGCNFTHLGATALAVKDTSQWIRIVNNTFSDVSCAGVAVGQVSDVNTSATTANAHYFVDGNLFDNIPSEFHDCPAILGGYVLDANVTNNAILNASNGGICFGWGWSRDEATNSGSNTIARNYIYRSNWLLEDCGSLYVLGPQPNSLMAENFCSNQVKLFGALYTDEGSAFWHITRNVVHAVPEWLHVWTSSIHDELVDENWSDQTYSINHGTRVVVVNNTFITPGTPFPAEAQAVMAASGPAWWTGARV